MVRTLRNYINGQWSDIPDVQALDVTNPAIGEVLTCVPLSPAKESFFGDLHG